MKRVLPEGPVWERARAEKNWSVAGIGETKVPVNARAGIPMDREAASFMTFEAAAKAANALKKRVGEINAHIDQINASRSPEKQFNQHMTFEVAYLPRDGSSLVVGDFDKVRDPDTGEIIADWLQPLIDDPETYTEISVSGTGLHILTARHSDDHGTRERNGAGLYASNARFIVLTFNHLEGTPTLIKGALRARQVIEQRTGKAARIVNATAKLGAALPEDQHDASLIPDILRTLENPNQDYDEWVRMAHAVWAAAQDADPKTAFEIEQAFYDWSAKLNGEINDDPTRLWNSIKGVREIGPGSFYYKARELGWTPSARRNPPPMRTTMHKWIDKAFDGDEEALQRIARFMLTSHNSEDVAFVMITAMAHFTKIEPMKMLQYEIARADKIAASDMEEVTNGRGE
ncbi:PriCT-2 domain-containing protein [Tateyamaria sp. Alg231-49]|uniref:PriCT-2 domain-containing protein n=1 Tax=Tateyamaria sp. Alg231-49 TaxID=1922219 RepID=UPI000D55C34C|nr:PriCT-2 domain-containing protein [Tateyamaria sp. Alg231-49]